MATLILRASIVVAVLLAVLLLAYLGCRVREWVAFRRMTAQLDEVDARLSPLVFTAPGERDPDSTGASLLAQSRFIRHVLRALRRDGRPVSPHREVVEMLVTGVERFLEEGTDVIAPQRGAAVLRGTLSDIDNSLQTYSVYVPKDYTGDRPFPLVVHLHGHRWFRPFQGHPAPELRGAIVLSPEGRRATDYMWIGEEDVLRAIEEVMWNYRIDEQRVFITGTSMGGTGAWNLAVHHPYLFAGVAPRAGNCDFRAWEKRWGWNRPLEGQHRELRDFLLTSDSPVTYLGNLAQTPVYVAHAAADTVVPVEHAREAVAKLRAEGAPVEYREFLSGHHGDFPKYLIPEQLAWLASRPRKTPPRRYRFETRTVRQGRSYYVAVEQMEEVLRGATLNVSFEDGRLEVKTDNVLALSIRRADLPKPDEGDTGKISLNLDGSALALPTPRPSDPPEVTFVKTGGRWRPSEAWPPDDSPRKLRGLEGPVQDVFLSPFSVVFGTGGGGSWPEAACAEAQRFVSEWDRRFGAPCPIVADNALTTQVLRERNVVFFGRAGDETPMKTLLDRLPIRCTDEGVEVDGKLTSGDDVGTIFCYPTPGEKDRMTAVFTACSPEALYQIHTRFGNWFNWGVHDCRKWFDYAVFNRMTANPETYSLVGFFGTDWSFARGRKWQPTQEALTRVKPQGVPRYEKPPDVDTVYLSDLRPLEIDQMRGALAFDRSFRGNMITTGTRPYDRGLGVRCPSSVTFPLDGRFKRLTAVAALTAEPEEALSMPRCEKERAQFLVIGDGKLLHREEVDWLEPAKDINVNVSGVKELTLRVKALGGALWLHGSSAWADARVER